VWRLLAAVVVGEERDEPVHIVAVQHLGDSSGHITHLRSILPRPAGSDNTGPTWRPFQARGALLGVGQLNHGQTHAAS
jgi:hypothetical protein